MIKGLLDGPTGEVHSLHLQRGEVADLPTRIQLADDEIHLADLLRFVTLHPENAILRRDDVAAVWETILEDDYEALIRRILTFPIDRQNVIEELSKTPTSRLDRAFQTVLRNRVNRGGILAPGASLVKSGENGKGVASRWYPKTLARRIRAIAEVKDRITFCHDDALRIIPRYLRRESVVFFIDPPYTAGGKRAGRRLYRFNELDHEKLFRLLATAKGKVMLTYDDSPEPRELAERYGYSIDMIPMCNTHHAKMLELVITN